jgi:zinc protease
MFDPDRYALELLQQACSDLGSRLFLRIRDELGLAYYVGAQNFCGLTPGYFSFYCGTAPEHAERVEREILIEVEALRERGLDPAELRRAKAKVLGHHKIERQELGAMAFTNALDELYGLGCDHYLGEDAAYEAVTLEHVQAAARRCLTPDRYAITIVRPS